MPEATRPSAGGERLETERAWDQLRAGEVVDDFELLMLLGTGSFARVFLARQRSLERLVALKISRSVGSEPRTLAQLDHPHIVRVYDHRSSESTAWRLLYMELVPGGTLQDVVRGISAAAASRRSGRLILDVVDQRLAHSGIAPPTSSSLRKLLRRADWATAVCHLGRQLATGLAYAHEKGVLHRDIKPANILLTPEGAPKLADFNVSFQGGRADENPTDTFGGSLGYMSPEQIAACHPALGGTAHAVREASDIYAVGVVIWELMTGRRPFEDRERAGGWTETLQRMIDERRRFDPDRADAGLPSDCPASLRQLLARCLHPLPERRFPSASRLADGFTLCLAPRCWKLLQPPTSALMNLALRFPASTVLLLTLLPSIVAAFFNYVYNDRQIISYLPQATDRNTFFLVVTIINAVAFPVGIGLTIRMARRAMNWLRRTASPRPAVGGASLLLLSRGMARVALALWAVSGIAYPLTLHAIIPESITPGVYLHFLLSLALCGVLAGTYPFFFVSLFALRGVIPELVRREIIRAPDPAAMQTLRQINRIFLIWTAFVPLLGILLILLRAGDQEATMATARMLLIAASSSGLAGLGLMYCLHRIIDEDLAAFAVLVPDDEDQDQEFESRTSVQENEPERS